MNESDRLFAIYKCQEYHRGQVDRQGAPYWLHPYRVALSAEAMARTPEMKEKCFRVGLAHDILEDCENVDPELLARDILGGDYSLLASVVFLTKLEIIREKYSDYFRFWPVEYLEAFANLSFAKDYDDLIRRMIEVSSGHMEVLYVKYCDNVDNSQPWRAKPGKVPGLKYRNSRKLLGDLLEANN